MAEAPYTEYEQDLLTIGRWIERERKARKWTQEQLAARAGVSRHTVYQVETGAGARTASTFAMIYALEGKLIIRPACIDTSAKSA